MPRLIVFNQVTLDGYFAGEHGDLSWAHTSDRPDAEWKAFVEENAKGGDEGRHHSHDEGYPEIEYGRFPELHTVTGPSCRLAPHARQTGRS